MSDDYTHGDNVADHDYVIDGRKWIDPMRTKCPACIKRGLFKCRGDHPPAHDEQK